MVAPVNEKRSRNIKSTINKLPRNAMDIDNNLLDPAKVATEPSFTDPKKEQKGIVNRTIIRHENEYLKQKSNQLTLLEEIGEFKKQIIIYNTRHRKKIEIYN